MKFCKDIVFGTIEEFKDVVVKYSITQRYELRFSKNEANKANVEYIFSNCLFRL